MFYKNYSDYVELKIHPIVILFSDTIFSSDNATGNQSKIGDIEILFKEKDSKGSPAHMSNRAEVLVKTSIPLELILNIYKFL